MRVHLIDGTYELFRAFHGAPPASSPSGNEVGALRSLARQLLGIVRREEATHVGVAFDTVIESFRNLLFDGYKTGAGLEPALLAQFAPAEELTRALGFVVWSMIEFEADDALATAAARFARLAEVEQVRIVTPDKDLAQCVRGKRVVQVRGEHELDEDGVRERFGIAPGSIPDHLALIGDAADGFPGLPGFGARTSATLLAAFGHLEAIPGDPREWPASVRGAPRLAATLALRREEALLYRTLATLRIDVPLAEDLAALEWRGARREALGELCAGIGDPGLLERVPRWRE